MRIVACLVMGMMVLAAIAGTVSGAEEEDTCAVLFDFGNGQVMWADVPVTEGMNAFNVTVEAAEKASLALETTDWGAMGMAIDSIGGFENDWGTGISWNLMIWNSSSVSWEPSSMGASSVSANLTEAIAWTYDHWSAPDALATPEHRYPWTSFRCDSFNVGLQEFGSIDHPALNWSKDLGNGAIDTSVVGANGLIYVITGGQLNPDWTYATNASLICMDMSGEEIWREDIGVGFQIASPLLYSDMVIAPSADGKLYAFDATNGGMKWTFDTGSASTYGITSSPVAYVDHIIVAAGNGKLYSLYASNGTEDWSVAVATTIYSSSPAVHNGIAYIGDDSGNVSAYAAADGAYLWSTPVGGKVRASPLIDVTNGVVVVTSSGAHGNMTGLNLTGAIAWQSDIGGSAASAAMTSEGYVVATATDIIMVNFAGEKLWNYSLGETFGGGAPTVVGDTIFIVTNEASGRLVAVNMTGSLVNETVLAPANYAMCAPTFIDGFLFVTSDNGHIYAFSTGSEEIIGPGPEAAPEEFPWLLVGGIVAVILIAAVGLVFWRSKKA